MYDEISLSNAECLNGSVYSQYFTPMGLYFMVVSIPSKTKYTF